MEWDDPLVVLSLRLETCQMCDSSYDRRSIREHLADEHKICKSPREGAPKSGNGDILVREHTRSRPRRKGE
jgi:hypothetical protein